jgi:uncharacterized membrane protein YdjX (TVP38/TMEM64 family)
VTTPLFSTAGVSFWHFLAACVLSVPRSFLAVYIGSSLEDEANGGLPFAHRLPMLTRGLANL